MSRFSGKQFKGAMRVRRQQKRTEAEQRNAIVASDVQTQRPINQARVDYIDRATLHLLVYPYGGTHDGVH